MHVKMLSTITGTRNGADWPAVGGVIELPDGEAVDMIAAGLAEAASTERAPVERATAAPGEKRNTSKPAK
jgi:hypothetical protein